LERFADVGGVADQVDGAVAEMVHDQVEQLAGQQQRGAVGVAGDPQPGQDGQAHRPGEERQVDDDADHHPAVAPGGPVTAGAVAVVVPGRAVQLWPLRRQSVSSVASTTGAPDGSRVVQIRSSSTRPSWSADQRAVAKNR